MEGRHRGENKEEEQFEEVREKPGAERRERGNRGRLLLKTVGRRKDKKIK